MDDDEEQRIKTGSPSALCLLCTCSLSCSGASPLCAGMVLYREGVLKREG